MNRFTAVLSVLLLPMPALAGETINRTLNLPGASLSQELTYSTTQAEFNAARDARLERMRNGDYSAFSNSESEPTVTVRTTAMTGFAWRGVGLESGKTYTCTYTAAEDALWIYEGEQEDVGDDERFKKCPY